MTPRALQHAFAWQTWEVLAEDERQRLLDAHGPRTPEDLPPGWWWAGDWAVPPVAEEAMAGRLREGGRWSVGRVLRPYRREWLDEAPLFDGPLVEAVLRHRAGRGDFAMAQTPLLPADHPLTALLREHVGNVSTGARVVPCARCGGTGALPFGPDGVIPACGDCDGRGVVPVPRQPDAPIEYGPDTAAAMAEHVLARAGIRRVVGEVPSGRRLWLVTGYNADSRVWRVTLHHRMGRTVYEVQITTPLPDVDSRHAGPDWWRLHLADAIAEAARALGVDAATTPNEEAYGVRVDLADVRLRHWHGARMIHEEPE